MDFYIINDGVVIIGIGINILGLQKVRVGNMLPALLVIVIIIGIKSWI